MRRLIPLSSLALPCRKAFLPPCLCQTPATKYYYGLSFFAKTQIEQFDWSKNDDRSSFPIPPPVPGRTRRDSPCLFLPQGWQSISPTPTAVLRGVAVVVPAVPGQTQEKYSCYFRDENGAQSAVARCTRQDEAGRAG